MRDAFPFLRVLTLPIGAVPGEARVVIDGPNGRIDVFDSTGLRVLTMSSTPAGVFVLPAGPKRISLQDDGTGSNPVIVFRWTGEAATDGRIDMLALGSYDTGLRIAAPFDTSADQAQILLFSEDVPDALPPTFRFRDENGGSPVDLLQLDGGASPAATFRTSTLQINPPDVSGPNEIPRGVIATTGAITSSTGTMSGDTVVSGMSLSNVPAVSGRFMMWHFRAAYDLNGASAIWSLYLRRNGTNYARLKQLRTDAAGDPRFDLVDTWVIYVASSTTNTDDWEVFADEESGTATLELFGSAGDAIRDLTLIDFGDATP